MSNGAIKACALIYIPLIVGICIWIGVSQHLDPSWYCMPAMIFFMTEIWMVPATISIMNQEKTKDIDEKSFEIYMVSLNYHEIPENEFRIKMTGRRLDDPTNISVGGEVLALIDEEKERPVPSRFSFYTAGKNDQSLLVYDRLLEEYRLFRK